MTRYILLPVIRIEPYISPTMPRFSRTVSLPIISTTYSHPGPITHNHRLMSNEVFITTGVQAQRSSPRLNIISLQQNEKQFSLFVQALSEWIIDGLLSTSCALRSHILDLPPF